MEDQNPMLNLDEWQDAKVDQYMHELAQVKHAQKQGLEVDLSAEADFNATDASKKKEQFRNYEDSARQKRVESFYRLQHANQTYQAVCEFEDRHLQFNKARMGIWEALEYLDQVVDDSDPDTDLTQIEHALQTAEAVRRKWPGEENDWLHVTGLIHDLGKLLAVDDEKRGLSGDPQWAVVGDTFPVGMPFADTNILHETFKANPDYSNRKYNTGLGIYERGCGLYNVKMSWGHDEYLFRVLKHNNVQLPLAAMYIIRYHSFYPWHKEGGYMEVCNEQDLMNLQMVKEFNECDLYSKSDEPCDIEKLTTYYKRVIAKYFPETLEW